MTVRQHLCQAPGPATAAGGGDTEVELASKRALISGAGSGIGKATALAMAAAGASVVVSDIDDDRGRATVEQIVSAGGTAHYRHCDTADNDDVVALVGATIDLLGGVDLAVNNVGVADRVSDLHMSDIDDFDNSVGITLRGTYLCMRAELAHMVEHGGGAIVNTASGAGIKNAIGMPAYTAAKHGVVGLTKHAGQQYADRNIRVNCVCPGSVATDGMLAAPADMLDTWTALIPMGRMGTPDEIAQVIVFLLSDRASFITSVALPIDGGYLYS
jgi:NAD(P)-dependent dehydrogenase (short-subunit alcohol dehydrogenase family)